MESVGNSNVSVYSLGKLKNKYIIMEVLGFAGTSRKVGQLLYSSSHMFRILTIRNHLAFTKLVKRAPVNPFDFDQTAAEQFGLSLKLQRKIKSHLKMEEKQRFVHQHRGWLNSEVARVEAFAIIEKLKGPLFVLNWVKERRPTYYSY